MAKTKTLHGEISAKVEGGKQVIVTAKGKSQQQKAIWGTWRSHLANLIEGVSKGYEKTLEISGVGYRATVQGKNLHLSLGYSHDLIYPIPDGIAIATPRPTEIPTGPAIGSTRMVALYN